MATTTLSVSNGNRGKIYTLTYSVSSTSTATTVTLTSLKVGNSSWAGSPIIIRFYADSTSTQITSITDDGWAVDSTHTINSTYSWNKAESAQTKHLLVYGKQSVNGSESTIGTTDIEVSVPALAKYAVTYNANGGSGAPATQYKVYGKNLTLSTVKPTRSGFSFVKWFTAANGTGTGYNPGATYSSNAALNLYAKWSAIPSVTSLKVIRSDENGDQDDSGTYAAVTATWTMDSSTSESATVTGTITPQGGTSSAITLSGTTTGTGGTVTALVADIDTDTQYVVAITAANGSNTATRSAVLTRAFFIMDFKAGGGGIGIGRAAPSDGLAVGYNAEFDGNVDILGNANIYRTVAKRWAAMNYNTAPSSTIYAQPTTIYDNAGNIIGHDEYAQTTAKSIQHNFAAVRQYNGSAWTWYQSSMTVSSSGAVTYSIHTPAAFRAAISAMGAKTANGYTGMTHVNGTDANWIRTTQSGLIPYQSGGSSALGTSSWPFNEVWATYFRPPKVTSGISYITGNQGTAALYLSKNTGDIWYPAITLDTTSGGSWSIGNYNNENLQFSWASKANRDSSTNSVTVVNLPNNAGTIPVPVQLYYNATGTDGTVSLSQTAANFNYLRIYYKKNGDSNACGSTDVYAPNGKRASLVIGNYASSNHQVVAKYVNISGQSIKKLGACSITATHGTTPYLYTNETALYIYRVEGWK